MAPTPEFRSAASAKSTKRYLPPNGVRAASSWIPSASYGAPLPPATMTPTTRRFIARSLLHHRPHRPTLLTDPRRDVLDPLHHCCELLVLLEARRDAPPRMEDRRVLSTEQLPELHEGTLEQLARQIHRNVTREHELPERGYVHAADAAARRMPPR